MAYCRVEDVDLGSMEFPRGVNVANVVELKAKEIDARIGRIYETPLQFNLDDPEQRPYGLLLQTVNAYLATGDIVIRGGGARQDTEVLAYGMYFIRHANNILNEIVSGKIKLPFKRLVETAEDAAFPLAITRDSFSRVEEFHSNPPIAPWVGTREGGALPWE